MMPIMMGVFSLLFPAGLAVYMLTNTVLGMIHQLYMNKTDDAKPATATVAATAAPAPAAKPTVAPGAGSRPPKKSGKNRAKA
jgi:membrane protein insertase Oxa1/YidC/SpoIIIJ